MKNATFVLAALVIATGMFPAEGLAALPEGKVAVVRVSAVDGLSRHSAEKTERTTVFSFDGTEYSIDKDALASLDGVQTLLLIDRRTDKLTGKSMVRHMTQEVRAYDSTNFEVKDLHGKVLAYQVAMIGGNMRLLGDGDQILALPGTGGPFQVWKVTGFDLVDQKAIKLQ